MQTALEKLQFDVEQGTRDVSELAEVRFIYIYIFSFYLMTEYLYISMLFVNDYYFLSVFFKS